MDGCKRKAIELFEQKEFPCKLKKKVTKSFEELMEIVVDNKFYNSNVVTYIDENLLLLKNELELLIIYKRSKDLNKIISISIESKEQLEQNLEIGKENIKQTDRIIQTWTDNIKNSQNRILKDLYEFKVNSNKEVDDKANKIKEEIDKLINKINNQEATEIFEILKAEDESIVRKIIEIKENLDKKENEQLRIVDYKIDADKMPTLSTEIFENNIETIKI